MWHGQAAPKEAKKRKDGRRERKTERGQRRRWGEERRGREKGIEKVRRG